MKKVVITGGAGGIGSAITRKFVQEGCHCFILDVDEERGNSISKELGEKYCTFLSCDVTKESDLTEIESFFSKETELHSIITLAGRALEGEWVSFEEQTLSLFRQSISLNLQGHMNVIHSLYPALKQSSGNNKNIIMVSSVNALAAYGLPAYSAAKAGLTGFMNAVVDELGKEGIRINTLMLGTVVTPATMNEPKDFSGLLKGCALNKFTDVLEVADIVYAISSSFTAVTGQSIIIDSGQSKMVMKWGANK